MVAVQELLQLDFGQARKVCPPPIDRARQERGRLAYLSGQFAEDSVARFLQQSGLTVIERRWRGAAGEIDMICRAGSCVVFVEVKRAATHAEAALRLSAAQQGRICLAAQEYCGRLPGGQSTEMRFDLLTVDALGRIEHLENAFGGAFC
ncbi:YraN family protein [Paracoccus caeni]|uniref:UPF0102 protein JJJ17_04145 n=1 Tax=Paracoccus caeni TaxID=657651 RepID=A0A934SD18_9RHOB|nr:YraN family protein [Paracoccus caeni]MBK4215110.1 YraN family protein [Paracoccus caeni]